MKIETAIEMRFFDFSNQALIYYLIYTLISYSLCIFRGKVDFKKGLINRKKIIKEIISDNEITEASKYYKKSKNESIGYLRLFNSIN